MSMEPINSGGVEVRGEWWAVVVGTRRCSSQKASTPSPSLEEPSSCLIVSGGK